MRLCATTLASALTLIAASAPAAAQAPGGPPAHQQINAACTRCHTADRILKADPGQLRSIVDRMEAKSPELFRDTDKAALLESLARVLGDSQVAAGRSAWDEAVARGKALFNDPALGATGKSCGSCHQAEGLRGTAERYPAFDQKLGRLVSLQERLRSMIVAKLGGKEPPLDDPGTIALEAYLTSLR